MMVAKNRRNTRQSRPRTGPYGFSMIELVVTVAIILIVVVIAIPLVQSTIPGYRLKSAVQSVKGVVQATRYRAISDGFPYQLVLNQAAGTYQVQNNPNWQANPAAYVNIGAAVPLSGSSTAVTLSGDTTLQFRPSGLIVPVVGANTFSITLGGKTETFTISTYGNINVTP